MSRATVIIAVDSPDEEDSYVAWLEKWKEKLPYVSENYGCGCCVLMFDIEAPDEALAELPAAIRGESDWTCEKKKSAG